ncbi:MAG: hypothetical protein ACJ8E1_25280 [Xanthobacteraceae bacterium]
MTKLLEQAIAQVRQLPDEAQDAAAEALFAHVAHHDRPYRLSDEQVEEVTRRQQALREGKRNWRPMRKSPPFGSAAADEGTVRAERTSDLRSMAR